MLAGAQDMERRKAHDAKELRDLSRQMYLTKREQQKLDELRDKIEDEERMFAVRPTPQRVAPHVHAGHTLSCRRAGQGGKPRMCMACALPMACILHLIVHSGVIIGSQGMRIRLLINVSGSASPIKCMSFSDLFGLPCA